MELNSQITERFGEKAFKCLGYHDNCTELTKLDLHYSIKTSQFRSKKKDKIFKRSHILKVLQELNNFTN